MKLPNQRGFAPLIFIIIIVIIGTASMFTIKTLKNPEAPEQAQVAEPTGTPAATPSATSSPSSSPKPTKVSTTPTSSPTSQPSSSSCSYKLNSATGAVKVDIKPRSGLVVGDQTVELQARSGCKVLEGASSDRQLLVARAGGNGYSSVNSVTFSSVPDGPYSVRIQYKGQWTGYSNTDAVSGQSRTVEFFVEGETPSPTPTPTPKPKPACSITIMPSSTGTAPYQASICVSNDSNPYQEIQQEFTDYNGDGTWDYQGSFSGCHSYTFHNRGTYSPKAKIVGTSGAESDTCQATVTAN